MPGQSLSLRGDGSPVCVVVMKPLYFSCAGIVSLNSVAVGSRLGVRETTDRGPLYRACVVYIGFRFCNQMKTATAIKMATTTPIIPPRIVFLLKFVRQKGTKGTLRFA